MARLGVRPRFGRLAVPKHVIAAYKYQRVRRIRTFLFGLDSSVEDLPREDRARFDEYISSEEGGRLLADFVDEVVRNRSQTALASLAILFSSRPSAPDLDFTARAARALEGISERTIDTFLAIFRVRPVPDGRGAVNEPDQPTSSRDPDASRAGLERSRMGGPDRRSHVPRPVRRGSHRGRQSGNGRRLESRIRRDRQFRCLQQSVHSRARIPRVLANTSLAPR